MVRMARRTVCADKTHRNAVGFARNVECDFVALQPYRAAAFALYRTADHLAGNLPLAFPEHMVDRRPDRSQPPRDLAFGHPNRKSPGKFLRYESGGKIALAPARMIHQRGEERNVMADAVDVEGIERG